MGASPYGPFEFQGALNEAPPGARRGGFFAIFVGQFEIYAADRTTDTITGHGSHSAGLACGGVRRTDTDTEDTQGV